MAGFGLMNLGVMMWPHNTDACVKLAELGNVWIRAEFNWTFLQPNNRSDLWQWGYLDQFQKCLTESGFKIIGLLSGTPGWASSCNVDWYGGANWPPRQLDDYLEYIRAVVNRYKAHIHHWEVGNEPNHPSFWLPQPDPAMAGTLYRHAYDTIKAVDPEAYVISGGLAGVEGDTLEFYKKMEIGDSFEAIGLHCYRFKWRTPYRKSMQGVEAFQQISGHHDIWMTEVGWDMHEEDRIKQMVRTYRDLDMMGIEGMIIYRLMPAPGSGEPDYEILNADLTERNVFRGMREVAT